MNGANTDALMEILPDLLAPLLISGTSTDPARARRAAEQAIAHYQAGAATAPPNHADRDTEPPPVGHRDDHRGWRAAGPNAPGPARPAQDRPALG